MLHLAHAARRLSQWQPRCFSCTQAAGLAPLQHLRSLKLRASGAAGAPLLASVASLPEVPGLQIHLQIQSLIANDAALAALPQLAVAPFALASLDLSHCANLGADWKYGLAWIAQLRGLTCLDLSGVPAVSSGALAPLSALTALQDLNLRGCSAVSDSGVASLSNIGSLKRLNLAFCSRVGDSGIGYLGSACTALECLELTHCNISNISLVDLAIPGCPLKRLDLTRCWRVGDLGLSYLANSALLQGTLEALVLDGCYGVTEAGLAAHAPRLTALRLLSVRSCPALPRGAGKQLMALLPDCAVMY